MSLFTFLLADCQVLENEFVLERASLPGQQIRSYKSCFSL